MLLWGYLLNCGAIWRLGQMLHQLGNPTRIGNLSPQAIMLLSPNLSLLTSTIWQRGGGAGISCASRGSFGSPQCQTDPYSGNCHKGRLNLCHRKVLVTKPMHVP